MSAFLTSIQYCMEGSSSWSEARNKMYPDCNGRSKTVILHRGGLMLPDVKTNYRFSNQDSLVLFEDRQIDEWNRNNQEIDPTNYGQYWVLVQVPKHFSGNG